MDNKNNGSYYINTDLVNNSQSSFIKLYNVLKFYKNEINKASILETLNLDSDNAINKTRKLIDNELLNLEKVYGTIQNCCSSVMDLDIDLSEKLEEYSVKLDERKNKNDLSSNESL